MGSVLFVVAVVVIGVIALVAGATPLLLVPLVIVAVIGLTAVPLLARLRGGSVVQSDGGPTGVPTTREASYDPVDTPEQRTP